ncbi:MAG: hypothetical protein ACW98K_09425 [Candidatus Kariarchaeaceae archaeon]|jgi:hypothetical protein
MLKEATLVSSTGIPIWTRSAGPSIVDGILAGAMLGALSTFSTEVTGQLLRSVEMSDGFKLHIRPFGKGEINLALIGDEEILSDPELLDIIDALDEDINIMLSKESTIDLNDHQTTSVYLEKSIVLLDTWFASRVYVQTGIQKARDEQVIEISSQIAIMASRFLQENIAVMILDASLEALYTSTSPNITEHVLGSFQAHLRGWIRVSSHADLLLPDLIFFSEFCVGVKALKRFYIVCAVDWAGSIGSQEITSKIKSWLSILSRRLGP